MDTRNYNRALYHRRHRLVDQAQTAFEEADYHTEITGEERPEQIAQARAWLAEVNRLGRLLHEPDWTELDARCT